MPTSSNHQIFPLMECMMMIIIWLLCAACHDPFIKSSIDHCSETNTLHFWKLPPYIIFTVLIRSVTLAEPNRHQRFHARGGSSAGYLRTEYPAQTRHNKAMKSWFHVSLIRRSDCGVSKKDVVTITICSAWSIVYIQACWPAPHFET